MRFTKLATAVLLLSPLPHLVVFSQSHTSSGSTPKTDGIQVYAAADDSTLPIAVLSTGYLVGLDAQRQVLVLSPR